jgi:DNA-binding GntR family transcriptional regulator
MSEATYLKTLAIRLSLEGLAAEKAARHTTPAKIHKLRKLLERNDRAIKQRKWALAAEDNQEFNLALSRLAGMPIWHNVLKGLCLRASFCLLLRHRAGQTKHAPLRTSSCLETPRR